MTTLTSTHELLLTRTFKARRALVFACWVEQEHKEQWQGAPEGFSVTFAEADIKPGGTFKLCMRSPEGVDHWLQGTYLRIVKPELLEFTHSWLNEDGQPGHETLVTITFADRGKGTELTLRQRGFASAGFRDGHEIGWTSTLDRLTTYLNEIN
ncbi:MAG: SRPBCC domain-containing protein [Flavobacteriales bacterium]